MVPIAREIGQNALHPRYHLVLGGRRDLVPHFLMHDIPGSAPVKNEGHSTIRESFEHYAPTALANGWKHYYIGASQALEYFRMAQPTTKRNSGRDAQISRKLLKAIPLRPIADKC